MRVDHHTAKRSPKGVTGTAWTLAEDALLRARVNAGDSSKAISARMGRSVTAVEGRMKRLNLSMRGNPERMDQMLRDRWARAASVGEVTTALKLSRGTVLEMADRLGLPQLPLFGGNQGQPRPGAPTGISDEQLAWAARNAGHPEAALIMAMATEPRRRIEA